MSLWHDPSVKFVHFPERLSSVGFSTIRYDSSTIPTCGSLTRDTQFAGRVGCGSEASAGAARAAIEDAAHASVERRGMVSGGESLRCVGECM